MYSFARLLQIGALVIPPLAMGAQLSDQIGPGKMLVFLAMAAGIFLLGYNLQRHSR